MSLGLGLSKFISGEGEAKMSFERTTFCNSFQFELNSTELN